MFSSVHVDWFFDQILKGISSESYFDRPRYITTKVLVAVTQHYVYRKNKNLLDRTEWCSSLPS